MSTKTLTIKLFPLEKFYFGGDTFLPHENDEKKAGRSSYIVSSRYFPQQTSLLGMLRYVLLEQNGLTTPQGIPESKKIQAKSLIGDRSFHLDINNLQGKNDFGAIKAISPVFLFKGDDPFFITPNGKFNKGKQVKLSFETGEFFNGISTSSILPIFNEFEFKTGFETLLISSGGERLYFDEVFKVAEQVGIFKDRRGRTEDKGFYKQKSYLFTESYYSFAFNAELDENITLNEGIVSLGGDGSFFKMSISNEVKTDLIFRSVENNSKPCVVGLSPAFIDAMWLGDCLFHVSDLLEFRFLQTNLETQRYYNVNTNDVRRSEKFNLADRGSVFYFNDLKSAESFKTAAEIPSLHQIGYNHFEIINIK